MLGAPESTSQTSIASPKNGARNDSPPMKSNALDGVRYFGCRTPNHFGSMPERAIEYISREAPNSSEFHDVRIPAIPPAISTFAITSVPNSAPIASAVAISAWAISFAGIADEVVRTVITYQMVARTTAITTRRPICRGGMFTSSADCGMTSKPTNRNGTTTRTAKYPPIPPVKKGSMFSVDPPVKEPKTSIKPMIRSSRTTKVWATPASFTPRILTPVMTTAATAPTRAQVRCTWLPAISHSGT